MIRVFAITLALGACLAPAFAQDVEVEAKFTRLEGGVLLYDTETLEDYPGAEVSEADVDVLRRYLTEDPAITTLRLHSYGGSVWAGYRMADMIIDYGLNTEVVDDCASACTLMFLAGAERTMARGGRLGFHNWVWSETAITDYYERRKEAEGWDSPFAFAAWLYKDTQIETQDVLSFQVERGVDAGFAIEMLQKGRGGLHYPRRSELEAAGVLSD